MTWLDITLYSTREAGYGRCLRLQDLGVRLKRTRARLLELLDRLLHLDKLCQLFINPFAAK